MTGSDQINILLPARTGRMTTTKLSHLTGAYILDTDSRIGFVARHAMVTKVLEQFDEFNGIAHLDGEDPSKSRSAARAGASTGTPRPGSLSTRR